MAYQEVCPDRVDLIHKHFRKLCSLLVDVDEWGQIAILSMLTRYARTQFLDPNQFVSHLYLIWRSTLYNVGSWTQKFEILQLKLKFTIIK